MKASPAKPALPLSYPPSLKGGQAETETEAEIGLEPKPGALRYNNGGSIETEIAQIELGLILGVIIQCQGGVGGAAFGL